MQGNIKNTVKDSIFCNLFQIKKYLLQLYQALHPEDSTMTEGQLKNVTINHIFTNGIYNDLCFIAGGRLLVMLEAQATWSINVIIRMFIYLAQVYHEYFKENGISLYSSKKASIPKPELYVVYTGNRKRKQEYISLSEEFFGGENIGIELEARVIYEGKGNDIISQYINFTKVYNEQIKKHGRNKKAILETIHICKDRDLLKEYLESSEKEVVDIMMALFDQEEVFNTYIISEKREAAKKAAKKAAEKATRKTAKETAIRFLKAGKCSIDEIRELVPQLDDNDIIEIEQELMQEV